MPQTKEAIDHAKAAEVPIVVAINKIDKDGADPERIKGEMSEYGLLPEDWGGDTVYCEIKQLQWHVLYLVLPLIVLHQHYELVFHFQKP